jgi:cob(I)alamin adenosyltransferase
MKTITNERRLTHLYTGNGKGKTTAAVGLAVRALGRGWKVLMVQFMKAKSYSGEIVVLNKQENFKCVQSGAPDFVIKGRVRSDDLRLAQQGFEEAEKAIHEQSWDMVILDEIIQAVDFDLLPAEKVLRLIHEKPDAIELVLTGRNAPKALINAADLVSEIREVKHPYQQGTAARNGIEY